jgi:hypothetical protein
VVVEDVDVVVDVELLVVVVVTLQELIEIITPFNTLNTVFAA